MNVRVPRGVTMLLLAWMMGSPGGGGGALRAGQPQAANDINALIAKLQDADRKVRLAARSQLVAAGDPAVPALVGLLKSQDATARQEAAETLLEMAANPGRPVPALAQAVNPLADLIKDKDPRVRAAALMGVALLDGGRTVEMLLAALGDSDEHVRGTAARIIRERTQCDMLPDGTHGPWTARARDKRIVDKLMACLKDAGRDVPWLAAGALGVLGDRQAVDPLIAVARSAAESVTGLKGAPDGATAPHMQLLGTAIRSLGALGGPQAGGALKEFAQDPNWRLRALAAAALGTCLDKEAIAILVPLLVDEHAEVSKAVKGALDAACRDPASAEALLAMEKDIPARFRDELTQQALVGWGMTQSGRRVWEKLQLGAHNINLYGTGLKDALSFLRDLSGLGIFANWRAMDKAGVGPEVTVTVKLAGVSLARGIQGCLSATAKPKTAPPRYMILDGVVIVSTTADLMAIKKAWDADRAHEARAREDYPALVQTLHKPIPKVDLAAVKLLDALDFLREVSDASVVVDWASLEKAGLKKNTPVTVKAGDVSVSTVLRLVLLAAADTGTLDYMLRDGLVVVSTAGGLTALRKAPRDDPHRSSTAEPADEAARDKLYRRIPKVGFAATPLANVLAYLSEAGGVPMEADWAVLAKLGVTRSTRVTLQLAGVSVFAALRAALLVAGGPGALGYNVQEGKVMVSGAGAKRPPPSAQPLAQPPPAPPPPPPKPSSENEAAAKMLRMADLYLQNRQKDKAAALYRQVIRLDPDGPAGKAAKSHLMEMGLDAGAP